MIGVQNVFLAYKKVGMRNPNMWSELVCDIFIKVKIKLKGQINISLKFPFSLFIKAREQRSRSVWYNVDTEIHLVQNLVDRWTVVPDWNGLRHKEHYAKSLHMSLDIGGMCL